MGKRTTDLVSGLLQPSAGSIVGAVLVALAELVLCCVVIRPRLIAAHGPHWIEETTEDDFAKLTWKCLRFQRIYTGKPAVVVLGSSTVHRSFTKRFDTHALSAELSEALGTPSEVVLLSANAETYEEGLVVVDQLPPTFRGAVIMMVADYKDDERDRRMRQDTRTRYEERIALDSPSRDAVQLAEGRPPRGRVGNYFLDHFLFFAARRSIGTRIFPLSPSTRPLAPAIRDVARMDVRDHWRYKGTGVRGYAPLVSRYRGVAEKFVQVLKDRGVVPIFLEAPRNPVLTRGHEDRYAHYEEAMREFADESGATYWNFNGELDLHPDEFQDRIHLGSTAARRRFEQALLAHVVPVLRPVAAKAGAPADDGAPPSGEMEEEK
jgi:hypothetical protein